MGSGAVPAWVPTGSHTHPRPDTGPSLGSDHPQAPLGAWGWQLDIRVSALATSVGRSNVKKWHLSYELKG